MQPTLFTVIVPAAARVLWLAWREARPAVQIIFLLRFLAAAIIAAETSGELPWISVGAAAACWLAITVAVYLVNGISDVTEDSVNGSSRPIATGALPRDAATAVAALSAAMALAGAALVGNGWTLLFTLAMLGLGWTYSMGYRPLKKHMPGFLGVVVAGGMLTYLAGWNSIADAEIRIELILFGVAMSLWMGFGGATKDLSDVKGDRLAGRRTWPVVFGERRSRLAMASTAVATGTGFAITSLVLAPGLLLSGSTLMIGSLVLAVTVLLGNGGDERNVRRRPYKVFMLTQYSVHLTLFARFPL